MKGTLLILPFLFFTTTLLSQKKNVSIRIQQGDDVYAVSGQEINLRKESFRIIVTLSHIDGVYLFSDFTDSIFRLDENEAIPDFENLPSMAMAEAKFNEDQELIISKDGWAYWFYDKKLDWHRFDKDPVVTNDSIVGVKTIKQFYFPDPEHTVPVAQTDQPLYLFFVSINKSDKKGVPQKELARSKIKINWQ